VLMGLTPSQAPALQRITVLDEDGSGRPLRIFLNWRYFEPGSALEQSVDAGALRLISSVLLGSYTQESSALSSRALAVLRRSWLAGSQAPPPVMELVLEKLHCSRAVLALLPAGLTHLDLQECHLELDSLTPVARQLPRLRVLGLDASVSAEALRVLLTTAQQRDALTVHVLELRGGWAQQLSAEEVEGISPLPACPLSPRSEWCGTVAMSPALPRTWVEMTRQRCQARPKSAGGGRWRWVCQSGFFLLPCVCLLWNSLWWCVRRSRCFFIFGLGVVAHSLYSVRERMVCMRGTHSEISI
jgi:hypothetical protein